MSRDKVDMGNGWFIVSALWLETGYRRRHVWIGAHEMISDRYLIRFRERPFRKRTR